MMSNTFFRKAKSTFRIFLCGDVMLGRGVDQILRHHVDPKIYEDFVKDSRDYVKLAVETNGPLPENRPVDYVWGDAKQVLNEMQPDLRLINLETAVTSHDSPWPNKGINYRMHPRNVEVITAAGIQCCMLGNNHVLDWQLPGLVETLDTLRAAGIQTVGAGKTSVEAKAPAIFTINEGTGGRILVFGGGHESSGVAETWAAGKTQPGVHYVQVESYGSVKQIAESVKAVKKPGDVVIFSIHWGGNWGWELEDGQETFAHRLIDDANVDVVHGHSSHHIKGVQVYKKKLIIYGCGDFLSDYEGIHGMREFRDDLSFMYFIDLNQDGSLHALQLVPMSLKRMQVVRASKLAEDWLFANMDRECARFGHRLDRHNGFFALRF